MRSSTRGSSAASVFAVNAVTYVFAVIGLLWATYPRHANVRVAERGFARLLSGVRIARRDPLIARILLILSSFSFVSVAFVGLLPIIAADNLGMSVRSWQYGVFYACFGLGATLGAVSVGTVFAHLPKVRLLRPGFVAFAVVLGGFALLRSPALAYPVVLLLGYAYFLVITSLSTLLQAHLADEERGRVMALWIMGFGGTVPLGVLVGGLGDPCRRRSPKYCCSAPVGRSCSPRGRLHIRCTAKGHQVSESHAVAYREIRTRVREVVESVDPSTLDTVVAATPTWRAHDVLAHLVGVTDDVINGRHGRYRERPVDPGPGRRPSRCQRGRHARGVGGEGAAVRDDSRRRALRDRGPGDLRRRDARARSARRARRGRCPRQRGDSSRLGVDPRRQDTRRRARDLLRGRDRRADVRRR